MIKKMKLLSNLDLPKISVFIAISVVAFYFGKQWSQSDNYQRLLFFSSHQNPSSQSVSISPNFNRTFNLSLTLNDSNNVLRDEEKQEAFVGTMLPPPTADSAPPKPLPIAPKETKPVIKNMGVLDKNGVMTDDFEVGDIDPILVESLGVGSEKEDGEGAPSGKIRVGKFEWCEDSMRDYIPCLDNVEAIKKLDSTEKGERFERHCPEQNHGLNCLVPAPKGYKSPIRWPKSRDEVWFSNVPHARLAEDKGGQNWITISKDKFKFPGGGTQFIHGADQYLDQIEKMVPEIAFGKHTRVVLDVGCGVASFGAYLFSRNVLTLSVAPKDVHENQIQFALERGVPAMVAAFATRRLLYPSQAFELIHCSRCRINWTRDDGILLLEVNRMLRAGGYFVWAAQPVYKHEPLLEEQWEEMVNLTSRLCWKLVKKDGYVAIWQKPMNNSCYLSRAEGTQPPLCEPEDDPDKVWYVDLKPCISRLPVEGYGSNVSTWPARLQSIPDRLKSIQYDAYISRRELYKAESKYWNDIIDGYVSIFRWKDHKLRNVLDMRAGFGGFAEALIRHDLDCWVLNVVPVSGPNTLPVIYDRGLIGVMHDWCEPFDTYPRTYDLLHAAGLFSIERRRCNISTIMLEMDRLLRPGGIVYIRDSVTVVDEVVAIGKAMGWQVAVRDTAEGPTASYKLLTCDKRHAS